MFKTRSKQSHTLNNNNNNNNNYYYYYYYCSDFDDLKYSKNDQQNDFKNQ
jgi:hypothetical protein